MRELEREVVAPTGLDAGIILPGKLVDVKARGMFFRQLLTILVAVTLATASSAPVVCQMSCPMPGLQDSQEARCFHYATGKVPEQPLLNATCCEFQLQAEHPQSEAIRPPSSIKNEIQTFAPVYPLIAYALVPLRQVEHFVASPSPPPIQVSRPLLQ